MSGTFIRSKAAPNRRFGFALISVILLATAACATNITTATLYGYGANSNGGTAIWGCRGGLNGYSKSSGIRDGMNITMYDWSEATAWLDLAPEAEYVDAPILYRAAIFAARPTGDALMAESCAQDSMDSRVIQPLPNPYEQANWSPLGPTTAITEPSANQLFYKVVSGNIPTNLDARQTAL